jgi:hypothetical protein
MGGENTKISDFLPFPDLDNKKEQIKPNVITKETAIAFRKANKDGLIPNRAIGSFFPYYDQIEQLTKD